MTASASAAKADYGIDAPGVIRNLAIVGALGLLLWVGTLAGVLPRDQLLKLGGVALRFDLGSLGLGPGLGCSALALWMLWSSKVSKVREREELLDKVTWRGDEQVLDVGCGRGLVLVGAAKRLTTGAAFGIDRWQAEDLSGNRPSATLDNAHAEDVRERVHVQTADMRRLPFRNETFDVVTSCAAIHNLYAAADRATAIQEIARVLKPGGHALISDIRHHDEYARVFAAHRCAESRLTDSRLFEFLFGVITFGSLRPNTLVARKSA
jgi:ubiquinone/menaquinone biosynthesis C-methylase UbiE